MRKVLVILCMESVMVACHRPMRVAATKGEIIIIDSTLDEIQDTNYLKHIAPVKEELEVMLNDPIGYAPEAMPVYNPECPMLNWVSDAILAIARELCPEPVDVAVVNIGGKCVPVENKLRLNDVNSIHGTEDISKQFLGISLIGNILLVSQASITSTQRS